MSRKAICRIAAIVTGVTLTFTAAPAAWADSDPGDQEEHGYSQDHDRGYSQADDEADDREDGRGDGNGRGPASVRPTASGTLIYYCDPVTVGPPQPFAEGIDAVFPQPGLDPTPPGPAPCLDAVPF